jgi:putative transcriptional regulator
MNEYFDGKILVAPPKMGDWRFAKTVLYMWKHDVSGAAGVVINKKMESPTFKRVCNEAGIHKLENVNPLIYYGGPVMDNLIGVLHTIDYTLASTNFKKKRGIGYTLDRKIVEDIASGKAKPKSYAICMGIATWDAGQLEAELECEPPRMPGSAWLPLEYDPEIVFNGGDDGIWEECLNRAIKQTTSKFSNKFFNN